jgi:preprotein translocase subunit SecE
VAKAVRTAPIGPRPGPRPPLGSVRTRASLREYLRGVWEELKKVVWPGREELLRMTGIVLATVVLFGLLIGGADYLLGLAVKQLYTTSPTATSAPTSAARPSTAPVIPPNTVPSSAASSAPIISP